MLTAVFQFIPKVLDGVRWIWESSSWFVHRTLMLKQERIFPELLTQNYRPKPKPGKNKLILKPIYIRVRTEFTFIMHSWLFCILITRGQLHLSSHWVKVSDVIKQAPRVHDWNVSNITQGWRPILPPDWEQSSSELMIVKWGQTAETQTEGGRQREEGGSEASESDNLVSRSLLSAQWFNLVAPSHLS